MNASTRREGDRVPDVSFRIRRDSGWATTDTRELFAGKNVVVFALPGAFTPTCSSSHLPRYNELAPVFRDNGIDSVVCLSVNDPYVMQQWAIEQGCGNVAMIPDGNASFTEQMGMLVDKTGENQGRRSRRYSMLVRDGRIEKMFIEPDRPGDPFEVSDADTMLDYINPKARRPDQVAAFVRAGCEHCARAKRVLRDAGIDFVEIELPAAVRMRAVAAVSGERTVPQVFANGRRIGGADDVQRWLAERSRR
ncbi:MAG TPA: glutathione peroxidase [Burkholderiaceae bacterium]|nr:glutathione peroxidase [Burkholderiaceae bacterium]